MDTLQFTGVQKFQVSPDDILRRLPLTGGETVVLSGTIVEGIGNAHSDYDVYVIGKEWPSAARTGSHNYAINIDGYARHFYDYLNAEGLAFDVEFLTFEQIAKWSNELERLYQESRKKTKIFRPQLEPEAEDFIHKLHIGMSLLGGERLPQLQGKFDRAKFNFIKYRNVTGGYPSFKDLAGAYISNDIDTCLFLCRDYLANQAMGLSHLTGNSNYKIKWIMQNLHKMEPVFPDLIRQLLKWFHADRSTRELRETGILEACDLIDDIYHASRALLCGCDKFYSVTEALDLTFAEYKMEAFHDPQTRIEFEHRKRMFSDKAVPIRDHLTKASDWILQHAEWT